jgi:hypothetical protein
MQDPASLQLSNLSLVNLASPECTKHAENPGTCLKEVGCISKSHIVLGQCISTLRTNQQRLAQTLTAPGRSDTCEARKRLAAVPYRHSKLTEVLGEYFQGEGRVVMIINANPYDARYEENERVMKFAALVEEKLPSTSRAVHGDERGTGNGGAGDDSGASAKSGEARNESRRAKEGCRNRRPLSHPDITPLPFVRPHQHVAVMPRGQWEKAEEVCMEVVVEMKMLKWLMLMLIMLRERKVWGKVHCGQIGGTPTQSYNCCLMKSLSCG